MCVERRFRRSFKEEAGVHSKVNSGEMFGQLVCVKCGFPGG